MARIHEQTNPRHCLWYINEDANLHCKPLTLNTHTHSQQKLQLNGVGSRQKKFQREKTKKDQLKISQHLHQRFSLTKSKDVFNMVLPPTTHLPHGWNPQQKAQIHSWYEMEGEKRQHAADPRPCTLLLHPTAGPPSPHTPPPTTTDNTNRSNTNRSKNPNKSEREHTAKIPMPPSLTGWSYLCVAGTSRWNASPKNHWDQRP